MERKHFSNRPDHAQSKIKENLEENWSSFLYRWFKKITFFVILKA